jgi:hypothetical protein
MKHDCYLLRLPSASEFGVWIIVMSDKDELAEMANDPDIQREIEQIQDEFEFTEFDGLTDDSPTPTAIDQ